MSKYLIKRYSEGPGLIDPEPLGDISPELRDSIDWFNDQYEATTIVEACDYQDASLKAKEWIERVATVARERAIERSAECIGSEESDAQLAHLRRLRDNWQQLGRLIYPIGLLRPSARYFGLSEVEIQELDEDGGPIPWAPQPQRERPRWLVEVGESPKCDHEWYTVPLDPIAYTQDLPWEVVMPIGPDFVPYRRDCRHCGCWYVESRLETEWCNNAVNLPTEDQFKKWNEAATTYPLKSTRKGR